MLTFTDNNVCVCDGIICVCVFRLKVTSVALWAVMCLSYWSPVPDAASPQFLPRLQTLPATRPPVPPFPSNESLAVNCVITLLLALPAWGAFASPLIPVG